MCAAALQRLGIGRVVYGCSNSKFGGCGTVLDVLPRAGAIDPVLPATVVLGGVRSDDAVALLRRFYASGNSRSKPHGSLAIFMRVDMF